MEKVYKAIEKYHWIWFLFLLIAPNFLEPTWFWRWVAIMVLVTIFVSVFIWAYYAWLFLRRNPLSLTTRSKQQFENLNTSQKKWHLGLFYLTLVIGGPFLFYVSSFPLLDTFKAIVNRNYVVTSNVTIIDRTTTMGTWFIGQSLEIAEKNISDGDLLLMFSFEHALEGEEYEVKYLPYSGLVLELHKNN